MCVLQAELKLPRFFRSLKAFFNSDQPRDDHGRWTDEGGQSRGDEGIARTAARRISLAKEAQCELQYQQDVFHCRMLGLAACYAQAALRYANCLAGLPIPPLNHED